MYSDYGVDVVVKFFMCSDFFGRMKLWCGVHVYLCGKKNWV